MSLGRFFIGGLELELRCADPADALSQLQRRGLTMEDVRFCDALTLRFCVSRLQIRTLEAVCRKRGYEWCVLRRLGAYWTWKRLGKRPVLVAGLGLLLALGCFLPTRVLFVRVEGNITVPQRLILEKASQCGIGFGASREQVRSEKMKNALLESLPQLQWAGVNTSGCVAVITVSERQTPVREELAAGVASIVALRDGIITELTATRGNALCRTGQAVQAGQVIISGYTDCGLSIQAVRAQGEVYGRTQRELTAVTPVMTAEKAVSGSPVKKYALIIGKNRINLYFGSGILDSSCVRIWEESFLTLPGGFCLPVALVSELWYPAELTKTDTDGQWLSQAAQAHLQEQMTAGRILAAQQELTVQAGVWRLSGRYDCVEIIGIIREEEIVLPNGTND